MINDNDNGKVHLFFDTYMYLDTSDETWKQLIKSNNVHTIIQN